MYTTPEAVTTDGHSVPPSVPDLDFVTFRNDDDGAGLGSCDIWHATVAPDLHYRTLGRRIPLPSILQSPHHQRHDTGDDGTGSQSRKLRHQVRRHSPHLVRHQRHQYRQQRQ